MGLDPQALLHKGYIQPWEEAKTLEEARPARGKKPKPKPKAHTRELFDGEGLGMELCTHANPAQ